jgi:GNAT superfamily N-acetyltransferase
MVAMTVRRAEARDAEAMARMIGLLFSIESDFEPDGAKQLAGIRLLLASGDAAAFVAEAEGGGEPFGMVTVQLLASTAIGGLSGLLEDLFVEEGRRREGVASALVAAAELWCRSRGAGRIQLLADAGNARALAFYDARGYARTSMVARKKAL